MLRIRILQILTFSLFLLSFVGQADAQMGRRRGNRIAVTGWSDDSHFMLRTFDINNNAVIKKVDARTGKSEVIQPEKTARELLSASMREGTSLAYGDIVSPDGKCVVKNRDNDLFYFRLGDKEWSRLTHDDIPEVNVRFAPDGTKLAYTKNKDLYLISVGWKIDAKYMCSCHRNTLYVQCKLQS